MHNSGVIERFADLRYKGQSYELTVFWNAANPEAPFHREHQRVYGYSNPERLVEVVTLRVRARIAVPKLKWKPPRRAKAGEVEKRRVYLAGAWRDVPVYPREAVPRTAVSGPALVLDYGATTLAPPGWSLQLDRAGNLLLRRRS